MTPQEAVDFFYALLLPYFHHGHERSQLDGAYKQVCEKLNALVTGRDECRSEMRVPKGKEVRLDIANALIFGDYPALTAAQNAVNVYGAIRPYLRSPEPVTVNLSEVLNDLHRNTMQDYEDLRAIVKAAYDAAGVKYVD